MDKSTFSKWGALVVAVLVIAIMISFATPFGQFIVNGTKSTLINFKNVAHVALDAGSGESTPGVDPNLPAGGEVNAETGEILDSWEVIINNVNNGTYATKYKVGDYKPLDLGTEGVVNMQIAALDADVLSDGTGKAHITWIAKELLATKHVMNSTQTNENGWAASEMRTYLSNDIYALIPETVRTAIVAVDKTYYDKTTSSTKTCSDKLWIPSCREVGFGTNVEDSGAIYSELFSDYASRIKTLNSSSDCWWLRSAHSTGSSSFLYVYSSGSSYTDYAYTSYGVALGFCM